ncbi:MAG: hypothetical protein AAGD22_00585 [Verrucomicrobiota bacterium]
MTTLVLSVFVASMMVCATLADAVEFEFEIEPLRSSAELTAAALQSDGVGLGALGSNFVTQSFPLDGSITLDVSVLGSQVLSVDFVTLDLEYVATLENPISYFLTANDATPFEGAVIEYRIPFDPALASGSTIIPFQPRLTLTSGDAGTESGTLGDIEVTNAVFGFVATAQTFDNPLVDDGFPADLGPYPSGAFEGQPVGPYGFSGSVSLTGNCLRFSGGTFFTAGAGGDGLIRSAQTHRGSFEAIALFRPVDGVEIFEFRTSGTTVTLTWDSDVSATYQVLGGVDLVCFPYVVATGVSSQGPVSTMSFTIPTEMQPLARGFFVIEEE